MQLTAKVDNEELAKSKLAAVPGKVRDKVLAAMKRGGFMIEADAKRNCPVDTGRLRASITTNWTSSGMARGRISSPSRKTKANDAVGQPGSGETFSVVVGSNVEYAKHVEFGFQKGKRPRGVGQMPWLYPAYQKNYNKILSMIKAALRQT